MKNNYVAYNHHGTNVTVRKDLKGTHRSLCLCYDCKLFRPDSPEEKCKHATALYEFLKADEAIMVSPVVECAKFEEALSEEEMPKLKPPTDY